jgi:hypothetical protein
LRLEEDPLGRNNLWNNPAYQGNQLEMFMRIADSKARTMEPLALRQGR